MAQRKLKPHTLLGARSMKNKNLWGNDKYINLVKRIIWSSFRLGKSSDLFVTNDMVYVTFDKEDKEMIREMLLITKGHAAERSFGMVEVWFPVSKIFGRSYA